MFRAPTVLSLPIAGGARVTAIAAHGGRLYALAGSPAPSPFDRPLQRVLSVRADGGDPRIEVEDAFGDLLAVGPGLLAFGDQADVEAVSLDTPVRRRAAGSSTLSLAVADGCALFGRWEPRAYRAELVRLDARTGATKVLLELGEEIGTITVDRGLAYVAPKRRRVVHVVDPATGDERELMRTDDAVRAMAAHDGHLYVVAGRKLLDVELGEPRFATLAEDDALLRAHGLAVADGRLYVHTGAHVWARVGDCGGIGAAVHRVDAGVLRTLYSAPPPPADGDMVQLLRAPGVRGLAPIGEDVFALVWQEQVSWVVRLRGDIEEKVATTPTANAAVIEHAPRAPRTTSTTGAARPAATPKRTAAPKAATAPRATVTAKSKAARTVARGRITKTSRAR